MENEICPVAWAQLYSFDINHIVYVNKHITVSVCGFELSLMEVTMKWWHLNEA